MRDLGTPLRLLSALVTAALALPGAACADVTVNNAPNGAETLPAGADCGAPDAATIQGGIDMAVNGETVFVCPGSYTAAATVNKDDLSLIGAQTGVDARTRAIVTANESAISNATLGSGGRPGLTIDGFLIENTLTGVGLNMAGTTFGSHVLNNVIRNHARGIQLASNSTFADPTVISRNRFTNNQNTSPNVPSAAIYSDNSLKNLQIDDNLFTNNRQGAFLNPDPAGSGENISVTGNEFQGNENAFLIFETTGVTVTGNLASGSIGSGFYIGGDNHGVEISGNSIVNGFASAIAIDNAFFPATQNTDVAVTGNTITGNAGAGLRITPTANGNDLEFHFNRVVGNTAGISNDDPGDSINAENNWWGCNAGPGLPGCDAITGASTGNVVFSAWLLLRIAAAPSSIPLGGNTAITAALDTNSDGVVPTGNLFPDGTRIVFGTSLGTIPGQQTTAAAVAANTLAGGNANGVASVSAALDGQLVSTPVTVGDGSGGGGSGGASSATAGQTAAAALQPGGRFAILRVLKRAKRGKVRVLASVPEAGAVVFGGRNVRRRNSFAPASGTIRLKLRLRRKARSKLRRRGKLRVRVLGTFLPAQGTPAQSQAKKQKLKLRRR